MSDHGNIADILDRGIRAISAGIDELAALPKESRSERYHWRNLASCVETAARVQAEVREQTEFESKESLSSADIRKAVLDFLSALSAQDKQALMAEAGLIPPTMAPPAPEAQPHA